jgi:hypothetical protein
MVSKQHKRYYNTGLLFAAKELVVRHYGGHDDLITELVASAHSSSFGGDSKDSEPTMAAEDKRAKRSRT